MMTVKDHAPARQIDVSTIPNAKPKFEPKSRYGNPKTYEVFGHYYHVLPSGKGYSKTGIASWYGMKFDHHKTSNGEYYDVYKMTAAHKTLPLPTYVKVTNLENGRQVIVKVNDRGPFEKNRLIDLSYAAAKKLDITPKGTGLVKVTAINTNQFTQHSPPQTVTYEKIYHKPVIYLQLGAYENFDNAKRLQKAAHTLSSIPCKIYFTRSANGRMVYRVQFGPIPNVKTADHLVDLAQNANLPKPVTVIKT